MLPVYLGGYCAHHPDMWCYSVGLVSLRHHAYDSALAYFYLNLSPRTFTDKCKAKHTHDHSLTHSPSHSHPHMQLHLSDTPHEDLPGLEDLGVTPTPLEDVAIATVRRYRNFYTYNKPIDDVAPIRRA